MLFSYSIAARRWTYSLSLSHIGANRELNLLKHICRMEVSPLSDFSLALEKAMGKQGSHPKQVIRF
jgi:hypothetical protein